MFNLPRLQALIAPLSAPIPSAISIAAEAYNYVTPQTHLALGWIAALAAFVGIETIGGASCYAMVKLHRRKSYGVEFWVSLMGILSYIGSGLYTLSDSPTIIFFFLAPFAYFSYSIIKSMHEDDDEKVVVFQSELRQRELSLEERRLQLTIESTKAQLYIDSKKTDLSLEREKTKQIKAASMPAHANSMPALPAPKEHKCQLCLAEFGSVQALNAHKRFCKGI